MVRILVTLATIFFLVNCHPYVRLPKSYFSTYKNLKTNNNLFNLSKCYVKLNSHLDSNDYKYLKIKVKHYDYLFFYNDGQIACISVPIFKTQFENLKNSQIVYYPGIYERQLNDIIADNSNIDSVISTGLFNLPENRRKIDWFYYSKKDSLLFFYNFRVGSGFGSTILSSTWLTNTKHKIKNNQIYIGEEVWDEVKLINKPDSSKSEFILLYNKYLKTGKRRHYSYYKDFEKYINKK